MNGRERYRQKEASKEGTKDEGFIWKVQGIRTEERMYAENGKERGRGTVDRRKRRVTVW